MTKTIFTKVMFVGRATTFLVGVAVIVALTVDVVSTALAGTGVGARFDLGKTNTVNAVTKLVGSVAGPFPADRQQLQERQRHRPGPAGGAGQAPAPPETKRNR